MSRYDEHPRTAEILSRSDIYSTVHAEIEALIFDDFRQDAGLARKLAKITKGIESFEAFPEGFGAMMEGTGAMMLTLQAPKSIKAFEKRRGHYLGESAKKALAMWREQPFFWLAFRIIEQWQQSIFTIIDVFTGHEYTLYSRQTASLQEKSETRDCLYLSLVFTNGENLQTTGIIHYYKIRPIDLAFYLNHLDPVRWNSQGINSVIAAHFIDTFQLDNKSAIPPVFHNGQLLEFCWSIHQFSSKSSFDPETTMPSSAVWEYRKKKQYIEMRYEGTADTRDPDTSFLENRAIYDTDTRELLILSLSAAGYVKVREEIEQYTDLPPDEYPQVCPDCHEEIPPYDGMHRVLMMIIMIIHGHLVKKELPWDRFVKPFDQLDKERLHKDHLDDGGIDIPMGETEQLNAFLALMTRARNEGLPFDAERTAKEIGIDDTALESILDLFDRIGKRYANPAITAFTEDTGIPDFTPPAPAERSSFFDSLIDSDIFLTADDAAIFSHFEALAGPAWVEELGNRTFDEFFEDLFIDSFDYHGFEIMNTLCYLFCTCGRQWHTVRDYAAEILKLFGHIFIEDYDGDPQQFTRELSRFILRKLCTTGFCEIKTIPKGGQKKNGRFEIRPSALFFEMFHLP